RSPRHAPGPFAGAMARVYEALARAVGALLAAAPPDTAVAVVSDHGSGGASDRVAHLNRGLAACGLLAFRPAARGRVAHLVRAAALRALPPRLQGSLVRRAPAAAGRLEGLQRFAGIDWQRTIAYSEELDYHPSVWLNLRGREPEGAVAPGAYAGTRGHRGRAADAARARGRARARRPRRPADRGRAGRPVPLGARPAPRGRARHATLRRRRDARARRAARRPRLPVMRIALVLAG